MKVIHIYDTVTKKNVRYKIDGTRGEEDRDERAEIEEDVGVGLRPIEDLYNELSEVEGA